MKRAWIIVVLFILLAVENMPSLMTIFPGFGSDGSLRNKSAATQRKIASELQSPTVNLLHFADSGGGSGLAPDDIIDGSADSHAVFAAADAAGVEITLPKGLYHIASNLTIANRVSFAEGARIKPASGIVVTLSGGFRASDTQHIFDISAGGSFAVPQGKIGHTTPMHFGADGVQATNQTAAVQAATNLAAASLARCYFPPGRYSIDNITSAACVWSGAGKQQSIIYATAASTGNLIEDSGNAAKWTFEHVRFQNYTPDGGATWNTNVTKVIELGYNSVVWGTGARISDVVIYDFTNAICADVNQNISLIDELFTHNCKRGLKVIGNGCHVQHSQFSACSELAIDLQGACWLVNVEIEAPKTTALQVSGASGDCQVFGLHISLAPLNATNIANGYSNIATLVQWDVNRGMIEGTHLDLSGTGGEIAAYTNFMDGVRTIAAVRDVVLNSRTLKRADIDNLSIPGSLYPPPEKQIELDGVDGVITLATPATVTGTNYTYECWMRSDANGDMLGGKATDGNSYFAYVNSATELYHKCNVGGSNFVRFSGLPDLRQWRHIVLRRNGNGNDFSIFVDGINYSSGITYTGTIPNNPFTLDLVGKSQVGFFFDGGVHTLRAWNRSLTDAECVSLRQGDEIELGNVLDLRFNEGSGTKVIDYSPNNIQGTISGGYAWQDRTVSPRLLRKDLLSRFDQATKSKSASVSGAIALSFDDGLGYTRILTLTGNSTLDVFGVADNPGRYTLVIAQDGTGGWTFEFSPTTVVGTEPTIDTRPGEQTLVPLFFDGTNWFHD